jgi:CheY-like chemotaxis protein
MIESIFLVDDEDLFHLVFEDACSLLNISLSLDAVYSTDVAETMFAEWHDDPSDRPKCAFIDLNVIGSSYDGIELIRKVNNEYGNGIIIGIISSSVDSDEIERAKSAGAMFWIVKSDEVEPRLEQFHQDYQDYVDGIKPFTVYK